MCVCVSVSVCVCVYKYYYIYIYYVYIYTNYCMYVCRYIYTALWPARIKSAYSHHIRLIRQHTSAYVIIPTPP